MLVGFFWSGKFFQTHQTDKTHDDDTFGHAFRRPACMDKLPGRRSFSITPEVNHFCKVAFAFSYTASGPTLFGGMNGRSISTILLGLLASNAALAGVIQHIVRRSNHRAGIKLGTPGISNSSKRSNVSHVKNSKIIQKTQDFSNNTPSATRSPQEDQANPKTTIIIPIQSRFPVYPK